MDASKVRTLIFNPAALRAARKRALPDKSLRFVARELLNVAPQTLSEYERGESNPSPNQLVRMCALYGIEKIDDLVTKQAA